MAYHTGSTISTFFFFLHDLICSKYIWGGGGRKQENHFPKSVHMLWTTEARGGCVVGVQLGATLLPLCTLAFVWLSFASMRFHPLCRKGPQPPGGSEESLGPRPSQVAVNTALVELVGPGLAEFSRSRAACWAPRSCCPETGWEGRQGCWPGTKLPMPPVVSGSLRASILGAAFAAQAQGQVFGLPQ